MAGRWNRPSYHHRRHQCLDRWVSLERPQSISSIAKIGIPRYRFDNRPAGWRFRIPSPRFQLSLREVTVEIRSGDHFRRSCISGRKWMIGWRINADVETLGFERLATLPARMEKNVLISLVMWTTNLRRSYGVEPKWEERDADWGGNSEYTVEHWWGMRPGL